MARTNVHTFERDVKYFVFMTWFQVSRSFYFLANYPLMPPEINPCYLVVYLIFKKAE
jgi:hypothetical protein